MENSSVQENFKEIQAMLTDLSLPEQDVEAVVSRLGSLLYRCAESQASERNLAFDLGVVKALLGILRCSPSSSLVSKVAGCLALLVHGNEEARERLGNVTNFFQLLMKHLSPSVSERVGLEAVPRVSWDLSRAGVYEQVLSVLQKLTYLNSDNQVRLAQSGGVKLIINLAMSSVFLRNSEYFSLESKNCLERLTLGKKLACRAAFVPESCSGAVLSSFDALSGDYAMVTAQYPAFYVSLATEDKKWIASAMIEKGVVWPDHTSFPAEGSKWTWVIVTNVENGSNVWCQFCREKADPRMEQMLESLDMPPPLSNSFDNREDLSLAPSDVYAAYCNPAQLTPLLSSSCFLSSAQWCRARLLRILPDHAADGSRLVVLLAVDFGFMMTLPESQLAPLPPECRGIPPQAVPCKLMGVAPSPPKPSVLEGVAGILRNLSFENDACRAEIAAQKGIEALLELFQCPNEGIVQQCIGALLNLSVGKKMRAQLGQKGAVAVLLRVCQQSTISEDLLNQSLHCLLNMFIQCSENTVRFLEADGFKILKNVEERYQNNASITKCIASLRKHLQGPSQPSTSTSGLLAEKSVPYQHLRAENKPKVVHQPKHFQAAEISQASETRRRSPSKPSSQKEKRQLYEARRRANGERVLPNPIYQCLGDTKDETVSETSSEADGDELLIEDGNKEVESEASGSVLRSRCYLVNCTLPGGPESDTRSFMPVVDITRESRRWLRRCVCSMMNLGKTSTIFMGVLKEGLVKGVKLNKEQRDNFCAGIDSLMTDFEPIITANLYSIHFVPVAVQLNGRKSLAIAEGYFVVELTLLESPCRQIYTISEKDSSGELYERCYYRMSSCNVQLSHQELRDIVAWEVANSYSSEVRSLEARLSDLKMKHHSSAVD